MNQILEKNEQVKTIESGRNEKVMGGIISPEVWLQMCKERGAREDEVQNEINMAICEAMYEDIPM